MNHSWKNREITTRRLPTISHKLTSIPFIQLSAILPSFTTELSPSETVWTFENSTWSDRGYPSARNHDNSSKILVANARDHILSHVAFPMNFPPWCFFKGIHHRSSCHVFLKLFYHELLLLRQSLLCLLVADFAPMKTTFDIATSTLLYPRYHMQRFGFYYRF